MTKIILHIALRLVFGICLFLSQFTSRRNTFFTDNPYLLSVGILVLFAGIYIWITASANLQKAVKENRIATSGPYKYTRHPIYTSMYILTVGLGFMFFAWLWFIVMIIFILLWCLECRKEEEEMIKIYGEEYINYRKNTGMFFPKILRDNFKNASKLMSERKRIENKSSKTAAYTCTCRASSYLEKEIHYKSDDYIAVKLLPRFVKLLLQLKILNLKGGLSPKGIYPYVIARTKYIDSIFEDSLKKGFEQILIIGAGFDTRAIRFFNSAGSNVKVYEIDTNYTLDAKVKQLKKRGVSIPENDIYISIDFSKEDLRTKLRDYRFDLNKKTLFILEGIIMYLSDNAIDETFKFIHDYSAPGSLMVFDYIYASVLRRELKYYGERAIYQRVKKDNEKWTFGIEEGKIESFLNSYNFGLLEHLDSSKIENKYFRNEFGDLITKVNGTHCIVLANRDYEQST